tara:strand:+ start:339 stop:614 length:276 start_codon:yes stop_codon:yes gene_type:complete
MAVGDTVAGLQAGGDFTFQPAVGVEVYLVYFGSWANATQMTDGTIVGYIKNGNSAENAGTYPPKGLMINNSHYVIMLTEANGSMYSGVQIK